MKRIVLIFLMALISGCAFGKSGYKEDLYGKNSIPELIGLNKTEIIETLGPPENIYIAENIEYWGYTQVSGGYYGIGWTGETKIIIKFENGASKKIILNDAGQRFGVLIPQGWIF
jgi:hypothetical protein